MVRWDFMLGTHLRLTEHERALITAMLRQLIGDVANEIAAKLSKQIAGEDNWDALTAGLLKSGLLDDQDLLALLLRRAEEERASATTIARSKGAAVNLLQPFIHDEDGQIAAAAMAALVARARRRDHFGGPVVELNDVEPRVAAAFVFAIAAGIAATWPTEVDESNSLTPFHDAGKAVLATHEPEQGLTNLLEQLTALLCAHGRINDEMIVGAIDAADISLLTAALASRAGIRSQVAFDDLMSRDTHKVMMLLRISATSRAAAAHLLGTLGDLIGVAPDAASLASFDAISEADVEAARKWRQFDRNYQSALALLGHGDAHKLL